MEKKQKHTWISIILSTIGVYVVFFVLPFYKILENYIGFWAIPITFFVWLVGIGFLSNSLARDEAFKKIAYEKDTKEKKKN